MGSLVICALETGEYTISLLWSKRNLHGCFERREASLRRVPDDADIDIIVTVAQMIADTANVGPWLAGAQSLGVGSKPVRRFANRQQSILHSKDGPLVFAKNVEIHASRESLDTADIF